MKRRDIEREGAAKLMWKYSEKAAAYFTTPRGLGHRPEGTNLEGSAADALSEYTLYLELNERGIIREAGFSYAGSAVSVATASQLMELVVGRSIEFCANIFNAETLERALGGLPETQTNAPILPLEALANAFKTYDAARTKPASPIVCSCMQITRLEIETMIREKGLRTLEDIKRVTFASTGCHSCAPECLRILKEINGTDGTELTPIKEQAPAKEQLLRELIEVVIDGEIRPALAMDGGDIRIHALNGNRLELQFLGACNGCASSATTFEYFIEDRLHSLVDPTLEIITLAHSKEALS